MHKTFLLLTSLLAAAPVAAQARPEPVVLKAEVHASQAEVWKALTTAEGVHSFFSDQARVEPKIGGAYEMYFLPNNPVGLRGGEGVHILAMEAPSRFFISWNAPPTYPDYRNQQTVVEFELESVAPNRTLVTLTHAGWGKAAGWNDVRTYFATAWKTILGRLQYRFDKGPIDWSRAPNGTAYFKAAPDTKGTG
jgi:uncharacterized protein YndB with AHSA1/START domain